MAGIFKLTSGGLMVNYRCSARCGHCLYNCSPDREGDYISAEPFLDVDKLCAVLRAAQEAEMPIDYIETSSSFVTNEEQALRTVLRVRDLGVRTLSLSISPYHNEFIALDKVLLLLNACREAGVTPSLWIDEFFPDMTALPTDAPHSRAEYEAYFGKNYWPLLRPRYGLHMLGRALTTHAKDMPTVSTSRIPHMGRSCVELGGRSHYHIDLYGRYIPPSCPGLSLPLSALGADPRSLLDFCKAKGFTPKSSYYNRCHLCQDMRLFLYRNFPGAFPELAPASFYEAVIAEN